VRGVEWREKALAEDKEIIGRKLHCFDQSTVLLKIFCVFVVERYLQGGARAVPAHSLFLIKLRLRSLRSSFDVSRPKYTL